MSVAITKQALKKLCNFFSIKNFISDLPRMLNEAFTIIYNCIMDFYNPDDNSISCEKGNIDYIVATTIVTQNLRVGDTTIDLSSLIERLDKLEKIKFITKDMIDRDIDTLPYYDPDASTN